MEWLLSPSLKLSYMTKAPFKLFHSDIRFDSGGLTEDGRHTFHSAEIDRREQEEGKN